MSAIRDRLLANRNGRVPPTVPSVLRGVAWASALTWAWRVAVLALVAKAAWR